MGGDAPDEQFCTAERNAQSLAGQCVDVSRCVTDQQHPAGNPAAHLLPQRARGEVVAVRPAFYAIDKRRERFEVPVESPAAGGEDRDPDAVVDTGVT